MEEDCPEVDDYLLILWDNSQSIYRVIFLYHITFEGAIRKSQSFSKQYQLFVNVAEGCNYIRNFRTMEQPLLDLIIEVIKNDFGITTEITLETKIGDIGIDSLEAFNLLYSIEETYKIRFDIKFIPETVQDIVNEVERLRKA